MKRSASRWISQKVRPVEDRRFLLGKGHFVNDIQLPGMLHVAVAGSLYAHARIRSIDVQEAQRVRGVELIVTGDQLGREMDPIASYLDTPRVRWYPLALGKARFAGEWLAAVVAADRYIAEDAVEKIQVDYEPLEPVLDPERATAPDSPYVHDEHGTNVALHKVFTWGDVEADFASAEWTRSFRFRWNRHSSVPIETFGVVASYDEGTGILDIWASIQMPEYPEHIARALRLPLNRVRVHYDVDVGGSFGVKRGIKQTVLAGYLARRVGRPVKFIEDRLENMRSGEAHGPDRIFIVHAAGSNDGRLKSIQIKVIDDNGAYFNRGALQVGKPMGSIVGPYHICSVKYEVLVVATNKNAQAPVRGFGQSPHNWVLERVMDAVARDLQLDRAEVRRRNLIQPEEFPYLIPSGTTYDSGNYPAVLDCVLQLARFEELLQWQRDARAQGRWVGIGLATCIEPSGGNSMFVPLLNPTQKVSAFPEGVSVKIDSFGNIIGSLSFSSSGQGHETLLSQVLAEAFDVTPNEITVTRFTSLEGLPTLTPVGSRMSVLLPGLAVDAAQKLLDKAREIAAHVLGTDPASLDYREGRFFVRADSSRGLSLKEIAWIAYRQAHRMPPGIEPGLQALCVSNVPKGGRLPDAENRVQMYPAFGFSAHVPVVEVDRQTFSVKLLHYFIAHDCGTVVNPDIVRGMVYGGVAQGIGATFLEEFIYSENGQLITQSLADYIIPSVRDIPPLTVVEQATPSPVTALGTKGVGEGGYMSAPAALCSAVSDALESLGICICETPITPDRLYQLIKQAEEHAEDK